jgi:hypothetical protein
MMHRLDGIPNVWHFALGLLAVLAITLGLN